MLQQLVQESDICSFIRMKSLVNKIVFTGLFLILIGCSNEQSGFVITGEFRFADLQENYVEIPPIHYKYADKKQFPIKTQKNGSFRILIPMEREGLIYVRAGSNSLPILARPGESIHLKGDMRDFPASVTAEGYQDKLVMRYLEFHKEDAQLREGLANNRIDFVSGNTRTYISIQKLRKELAKQYFGDTNLESIMYGINGEFLISKLESLRFRKNEKDCDLETERSEILDLAYNLHFFSQESLKAQRAGIRDFAIAFYRTFGVKTRLEEELQMSLTPHDIRYIAYAEIDSIQQIMMDHINDINALAHARMYLVAEYIGEAPFYFAEQKYLEYLDEFAGFNEYISFLDDHYKRAKRVTSGQPIIDFAFHDANGNSHNISDFAGNVTLLKFRASWCANCKYQDAYLVDIYDRFEDKGLEIVAVSIEEDHQAWLHDLQEYPKPWVNLYTGGAFTNESFLAYRGGAVPHYVLISADGTILRNNDFRPSFNLESILTDYFAGNDISSDYSVTMTYP